MFDPQIKVTRTTIFRGHYQDTYEWIGDLRKPIFIEFAVIDLVPFPLRKIKDSLDLDGAYYVRTDVSFWWITEARIKIRDFFLSISYRLILTANVWGLAFTPLGSVPSWKDFLNKK